MSCRRRNVRRGAARRGGINTGHSVDKNLTKLLARNSISRRFGVHYTRRLCVAPVIFSNYRQPLRGWQGKEAQRERERGACGRPVRFAFTF